MIPRAFPGKPAWRQLALLPLAALVCDYAENVGLAIILLGFPTTMPVVPIASLFTTAKWLTGGTSIILAVISSLKLLVDRVKACRPPGRVSPTGDGYVDSVSHGPVSAIDQGQALE